MKDVVFILMILLLSPMSHASRESHGGGGLICGDKVLLYDFFEATIPGEMIPEGLSIVRSNIDVDQQRREAFNKLGKIVSPEFQVYIEKVYVHAISISQNLPENISILAPTDINNDLIQTGCTLAGVASYSDEKDRLLIDPRLFSKMPPTDQAALWVHEVVYKALRDLAGDIESTRARKIVAYLFSGLRSDQYAPLLPINIIDSSRKEAFGGEPFLNLKVLNPEKLRLFIKLNQSCPSTVADEKTKLRLRIESAHLVEPKAQLSFDELQLVEFDAAGFNVIIDNDRLVTNLNYCKFSVDIYDTYLRPQGSIEFFKRELEPMYNTRFLLSYVRLSR